MNGAIVIYSFGLIVFMVMMITSEFLNKVQISLSDL